MLIAEANSRQALVAIGIAATVTLALMAFAPPGVPVIAASAAALIGLRRR